MSKIKIKKTNNEVITWTSGKTTITLKRVDKENELLRMHTEGVTDVVLRGDLIQLLMDFVFDYKLKTLQTFPPRDTGGNGYEG